MYSATFLLSRSHCCLLSQDYRENANPINKKPIKLWQYDLGTDHRYVRARMRVCVCMCMRHHCCGHGVLLFWESIVRLSSILQSVDIMWLGAFATFSSRESKHPSLCSGSRASVADASICVPFVLFFFDLIFFRPQRRRYAKNVSSLGGGLKSAIMGNEDFAMSDLLTSAHDLQYASRNYKFGLIPKVSDNLRQHSNCWNFPPWLFLQPNVL